MQHIIRQRTNDSIMYVWTAHDMILQLLVGDTSGVHGSTEGVPLLRPLPRVGQDRLPMGHFVSDGVHPVFIPGRPVGRWADAQSADETAPLLVPVPHSHLQHSLLHHLLQHHFLVAHHLLPDRVALVLNNAHLPFPRRRLIG